VLCFVSVCAVFVQALATHFPEGKLPAILEQLQQQYTAGQQASQQEGAAAADVHAAKVAEAGLGAVGLLVQFLSSNMLDTALLPNARYEALCEGVSSDCKLRAPWYNNRYGMR
jgi:hypothetical protein